MRYDSLDAAEEYYHWALKLQQETGDLPGVAKTLEALADLALRQDNLTQARDYLDKAFNLRHQLSSQFTWESGLNRSLSEELYICGARLARVQVKMGETARAFVTVQSSKGVALMQLLAQAQEPVEDPLAAEQLAAYRSAQGYLQELRRLYYDLPNQEALKQEHAADGGPLSLDTYDVAVEETAARRAELARLIEEHAEVAENAWAALEERTPELTRIIEVQGLSAEEVRRDILQPGQVLLEYMLVDDSLIIFILPRDGQLTVAESPLPELGEHESLDKWIDGKLGRLFDRRPVAQCKAGQALYKLLIAPVARTIPEGSHLIICPDGALFGIPFDALVDEDGALLLDKHSLSYSTSATMLSYIKSDGGAESALVAGVSFGADIPANDDGSREMLLTTRGSDLVRGHMLRAGNLPPLPGAIAETRDVACILGVEPLLDEQATETLMREHMPGREVIHLATHGFLNPAPLLGGVALYLPPFGDEVAYVVSDGFHGPGLLPGGNGPLVRDVAVEPSCPPAEDGFLTMSEVMGLRLSGCELVVLSCCHGFSGQEGEGQGLMGLTQGFMYAGVRAVIASQHKVDDAATQLLMSEFYCNWRECGMSKSQALRAAKQVLAKSEEHNSPRCWAPFVLYGVD